MIEYFGASIQTTLSRKKPEKIIQQNLFLEKKIYLSEPAWIFISRHANTHDNVYFSLYGFQSKIDHVDSYM